MLCHTSTSDIVFDLSYSCWFFLRSMKQTCRRRKYREQPWVPSRTITRVCPNVHSSRIRGTLEFFLWLYLLSPNHLLTGFHFYLPGVRDFIVKIIICFDFPHFIVLVFISTLVSIILNENDRIPHICYLGTIGELSFLMEWSLRQKSWYSLFLILKLSLFLEIRFQPSLLFSYLPFPLFVLICVQLEWRIF